MARRSRLRKKIPALTKSGGRLGRLKDAAEFRVWVHGADDGSDAYYPFPTLEKAIVGRDWLRREGSNVEDVIAVIKDGKGRWREVVVPAKFKIAAIKRIQKG